MIDMKKIKYIVDKETNVYIADMYRQSVGKNGERTTTLLVGLGFELNVLRPYIKEGKNSLKREVCDLTVEETLYYKLDEVMYLGEISIKEVDQEEDILSPVVLYKIGLQKDVMYLENVTGTIVTEVRGILQEDCKEYIKKRVVTEIEL